jgi:tetratricopeptide (TPR) repeat protein
MARKRKKKGARHREDARRDDRQVELLPDIAEPVEDVRTEADSVPPPTIAPAPTTPTPAPAASAPPPATSPARGSTRFELVRSSDVGAGVEAEADARAGTEAKAEVEPATAVRRMDGPAAPKPAGDRLGRARDLVELGRVEEAIALYREILADNPNSLKAHNNLGVLFDVLGRHEAAVEHFQEAQRIEPENVEVLTNHAAALTALGRFEESDVLLKRALRLSPDDPQARLGAGVLAFRRGLYEQAEMELRWVCDQDAENGPAFYYRGEALNRIGRFDESAELMEHAAELMPTDPRPFYTLGHLYDRRSLRAEANAMYRRARDLQAS